MKMMNSVFSQNEEFCIQMMSFADALEIRMSDELDQQKDALEKKHDSEIKWEQQKTGQFSMEECRFPIFKNPDFLLKNVDFVL